MLIDICTKFREYSLRGFQVIERTRFVTDRRTDRRTDGRPGKNNMSPDPKGGRHNNTNDPQKKYRLGTVSKNILLEDLNRFHGANLTLSPNVDQDT